MTQASKNPRVICTLLFVFLAGAVVGALSMRIGLHERLHRTVSAAVKPPIAEVGNDPLLQRLKVQLNLSDEQAKAVARVISDYRQYYLNLQDQLDDIRSSGHDRIVEVLNEEQRRQFEKMAGELQTPAK
jgi:hypothetical protein